MKMEFIAKTELIDKIYNLNSEEIKNKEVYSYDDGVYVLRVFIEQDFLKVILNAKKPSIYLKEGYVLEEEPVVKLFYKATKKGSKITKKDAKNIADFVFLVWNTRERKTK